ncbi:hypothetical protein C2845_PM08G20720 [Panicum miliaceum]|uniref:Uncharacterized protein n=1 Tax=Panicum miliaceum TaxID=4540 RepID=A0A3L6R2F2_PANMI|nr:hypothetical protein C2845_PM08G20720 [Panicum miliaceum]
MARPVSCLGAVVLIGAGFFAALIWARLPVVRADPFWDPRAEDGQIIGIAAVVVNAFGFAFYATYIVVKLAVAGYMGTKLANDVGAVLSFVSMGLHLVYALRPHAVDYPPAPAPQPQPLAEFCIPRRILFDYRFAETCSVQCEMINPYDRLHCYGLFIRNQFSQTMQNAV